MYAREATRSINPLKRVNILRPDDDNRVNAVYILVRRVHKSSVTYCVRLWQWFTTFLDSCHPYTREYNTVSP